jgi:hypothetical protein
LWSVRARGSRRRSGTGAAPPPRSRSSCRACIGRSDGDRERTAGGVQETGRSPDGKAGEAEGVAGAAERRNDGGLERGGRAVGDGADRVGVREGGVGGHSGGGGEGNHGEGREEGAAAVGHVAVTGFLYGGRAERDEMGCGGRGMAGLKLLWESFLLD